MSEEFKDRAERELAHQGYVLNDSDPEEWIPNQPNAQGAVADAMTRTAIGLPAFISWFPVDFSAKKASDWKTVKLFERKIWNGVQTILKSFSLEDEKHWVWVKHMKGKCFGVLIVKLNKPVKPWQVS